MIDSLTIFSKGGLILYQYHPTSNNEAADDTTTNTVLNEFIMSTLLNPTSSKTTKRTIQQNVVVEWNDDHKDWLAVAVYPEVVLRGRKSVTNWIPHLLQTALREYALFDASQQQTDDESIVPTTSNNSKLFDATFQVVLRQAETMGRNEAPDLFVADVDESRNDNSEQQQSKQQQQQSQKKGKEKTVWHDGKAKVTKESMAALDRSKDVVNYNDVDSIIDAAVADDSRALAEARAAYLPSSDEIPSWKEDDAKLLLDDDDDDSSSLSGWGSSLKGMLDQMSGNKVLTEEDLDAPLAEMQRLLTLKNVASDIATEICNSVKVKLIGKRMQSFARVKTAVRQALEVVICKLLTPPKNKQVDLLRSVMSKRDDGGGGFFKSSSTTTTRRPYVIVMVGINGVGKSTSLAKIAYYLKSNGCHPMLAACDTFRSGAVEQLNVHAKCLDVPLYHKGYAKDPSAVAKAAIAHATEQQNDVVLIDTAGRMQNNVPLMKALSKLVVENQPDLVLFVCEALVGNDGMDQLDMFNKALQSGGHVRQIDGIVLTKYDTVSDKVGAVLTMTTQQSAPPVVFVGTGQKYNHLKKLSVQSVIKSLFS